MALRKILIDYDFDGNQIKNVVVDTFATLPVWQASDEGRILYNEADNALYFASDTQWVKSAGQIVSITSLTNALTINDPLSDGNITLTIANADGSNPGLLTSAFFTDLTNATAASVVNTIVERDSNGRSSFDDVTITNAPLLPTDATNKLYVDTLLTSTLKFIGVIDASANPNYPAAAIGDVYVISVAGKIGGASGPLVEVGDQLLAISTTAGGTHASVGADWVILDSNKDSATETVEGVVELSTDAEAILGTDTVRAITPANLAAVILDIAPTTKFSADIGDGVTKIFVINHNLNTEDVLMDVRETVANKARVEPSLEVVDANNVRVEFNVAPASTAYRITIIG